MTTLEQSQQTDWLQTELELMSSREDSPAKTSQPLEDRQVLKASAVDCGQSAPVFLGSFDLGTLSLKTSQTCLTETGEIGLSEYSETFPRSGMMRNGTVYQLPRLAPTITEIGSGLLPTPTATANQGAPSMQERYSRPHFWRTPAASNGSQGAKSKEFYEKCKKTGQSSINLVDEVRHIWPTPSASDNRDRGNLSNPSLQRRIKMGKQLMLSQVVHPESGRLNPTWVEWLMGFPLDHTDLNA